MEFVYQPELLNYMEKTGKRDIVIELVSVDADIDVAELHVHFANSRDYDFFVNKERYMVKNTPHGRVLLPPYKLDTEGVITFGLKKTLWFYTVTCKGAKA